MLLSVLSMTSLLFQPELKKKKVLDRTFKRHLVYPLILNLLFSFLEKVLILLFCPH